MLQVLLALDFLDPLGQRRVEGGQLHGPREQGDPLVVEAVLSVLFRHEAVLDHRLFELPELGVDLRQLQMRMKIVGVVLEPRPQTLPRLLVQLEHDEVVNAVLLGLRRLLAAAKPFDGHAIVISEPDPAAALGDARDA
ncbi:MAG TPA: hypothetical protein VLV54_11970 [Thermoanaerobaculia bacterium]|nr:hypothetical protein [Thermoanaerobaculia bacterium]